jgi:hypothetical protein
VLVSRRQPPKWFQDRLARVAGLNRFGTPNFDVVWGETATVIKDGRRVLQAAGYQKCWVIREWKAPEVYGTVPMYFYQNSMGGKPITGGYPYRGRYEVLQPLCYSGIVNGTLIHRAIPLSSHILKVIIPMLKEAKKLTDFQRLTAVKEIERLKEEQRVKDIAATLEDASPRFKGAVSFSRQGCKNSAVQQKMMQIEQNWKHSMKVVATLGRGGYGIRKVG